MQLLEPTHQRAAELVDLLVNALSTRWRKYERQVRRCQKKFSEEAVHDLRVATRRLMSLLDLVSHLIADARLKRTRRALKRRLDMFDSLRDTQVQLLSIQSLQADFPELERFHDELARRERQLIKRLGKQVKKLGLARLEKSVKTLQKQLRQMARHPAPSDDPFVAIINAVERAFAKVVERRRAVDPADSATIHRTRVAFKRFRYMVEVLQPLLVDVTQDRLKHMHDYQTMMGDVQDIEVLTANLTAFLRKEKLTLPAVEQWLAQRRAQLIETYVQSADELFQFWNHQYLRISTESRSKKATV
ncbi:MAG: CHAD domain-containing protein [Acidobacteriota bacterium]|nr:CHAD domain-containing protein [Blastocatellia bacterium]MDW8238807.1 CHAD domain-containing protein [Acidobacteriota bacterium]